MSEVVQYRARCLNRKCPNNNGFPGGDLKSRIPNEKALRAKIERSYCGQCTGKLVLEEDWQKYWARDTAIIKVAEARNKSHDMFGRALMFFVGALVYTVVIAQLAMYEQRVRDQANAVPIVLSARPCVEDRTEQCFADSRGRELRVTAHGDEAVPEYVK